MMLNPDTDRQGHVAQDRNLDDIPQSTLECNEAECAGRHKHYFPNRHRAN